MREQSPFDQAYMRLAKAWPREVRIPAVTTPGAMKDPACGAVPPCGSGPVRSRLLPRLALMRPSRGPRPA